MWRKTVDGERNPKSEAAKQRPRDAHGHFVSAPDSNPSRPQNALSRLFTKNTAVANTHDDDTLIDVHVGNPLRKITKLLEELKRQKAFSFTLKGSLGIMGVALALSLFGIFGGSKMLCDKGTQSHIGNIQVLQATEVETSQVPLIGPLIDFSSRFSKPKQIRQRVILVKSDSQTIHIPYTVGVPLLQYQGQTVIVTGRYDSCSQTLILQNPEGIEIY